MIVSLNKKSEILFTAANDMAKDYDHKDNKLLKIP